MIFSRSKKEKIEGIQKLEDVKKNRRDVKLDDGMEWDKKRVGIALIILIAAFFLAYEFKNNFYDKNKKVLGESDVAKKEIEKPNIEVPINLSREFETTIEDIKKNILTLDPEEVATTSPQIQKVLKDIQGIKDLPQNEAKEACHKICSEI